MNKTINYENWKDWKALEFAKPTPLEKAYFSNILKPLKISSNSKILEIGFGNGAFLGFAREHNYNIEGVEVIDELLYRAKENNYIVYKDLQEIKSTSKYNLIVLLDVLEHIPKEDITNFLKQLSNLLALNGAVILRVPNGSSPFGLTNQYGDLTHCTIITPERMNYWVKTCQLCIYRCNGDLYPFIYQHNLLKAPSRLLKRLFYILSEKFVRFTFSPLSKGILSSNLFIILKKENNV